jgi:uncharacterized protein YndB with AHSA1/START domain
MKVSASKEITRSPEVVWRFLVLEHVRNHPRWVPKMELRSLTEGSIRLGSRIARRHTRLDAPIEGTMEVVEFEPPRVFGVVIHDQTPAGLLEVRSRMTIAPTGDDQTTVTIELEMPGRTESMDASMIEASLARMKELIEAET